jgi:FkbM family methyltransferase
MTSISSPLARRLHRLRENPKQALVSLMEVASHRLQGFSYDFYENGEYQLLRRLKGLGIGTIFDVGSNVGDWARIANQIFPAADIHCFELSSTTFTSLVRNLAAPAYTLNNVGLSDSTASVTYKDYGADSTVNTVLLATKFHDKTMAPTLATAQVTTGAAYCEQHAINEIDLLKIDVEGAESLVLKGFEPLFRQHAIRIVQFEYGYANGDAHFLMRDFFEFFESHGYRVGRLQKAAVDFAPWSYRHNDFDSGPNYVAIRQSDAEVYQKLTCRLP